MTGTAHFRAVRETEGRAEFDEKPNGVRHIILLFLREGVPPVLEFIGELDFPSHTHSMPYTEYLLRR
jgi:hypothetical protein